MKGLKYSFVVVGALALGCGGSQGVSGYPDPPQPLVLAPVGPGVVGGSAIRTYRAGDTWEYDVQGTMLREEFDQSSSSVSKNSGPITGTLVRTLSSDPFGGAGTLKVTDALTYKVNGGLITVEILEYYMRQEVSGAITMIGRRQNKVDFQPKPTKTVQPWLPAFFAPGSNVAGALKCQNTTDYRTAEYDNSTAFSVTNANTVSATTGTPFDTWRSVYTDSMRVNWSIIDRVRNGEPVTNGFVFNTVEDVSTVDEWSPVIGAPVKRKYGSSRVDSVVQGSVDYTPPVIDPATGAITSPDKVTYTYHTIARTLDVDMVLKRRSLQ
jgi:hypothetical protein